MPVCRSETIGHNAYLPVSKRLQYRHHGEHEFQLRIYQKPFVGLALPGPSGRAYRVRLDLLATPTTLKEHKGKGKGEGREEERVKPSSIMTVNCRMADSDVDVVCTGNCRRDN